MPNPSVPAKAAPPTPMPPARNAPPPPMAASSPAMPPPMGGNARKVADAPGAVQNVNEAKCQEALQYLEQIIPAYEAGEKNQKVLQDSQQKTAILRASLENNQVSEPVCQGLIDIFGNLQQGNMQGSRQAVNMLSQKSWNEIKDWFNLIKAIINFAQRSGL